MYYQKGRWGNWDDTWWKQFQHFCECVVKAFENTSCYRKYVLTKLTYEKYSTILFQTESRDVAPLIKGGEDFVPSPIKMRDSLGISYNISQR